MQVPGEQLVGRRIKRLAVDVLMVGLAFLVSTVAPMVARFGIQSLRQVKQVALGLFLYVAVAAITFAAMGIPRMVWRYVSFRDLLKLARAVALSVVIFLVIVAVSNDSNTPIPGFLLAWSASLLGFITLFLVAAPRLFTRLLEEERLGGRTHYSNDAAPSARIPILLVGAPARIDDFIRACTHSAGEKYRVLGAFTEDRQLHASNLNGVKIYGAIEQIPTVLQSFRRRAVIPHYLVLADDDADNKTVERLLEMVVGTEVRVGRVPPLTAFQDQPSLRPIMLSDLLGRPEISIGTESLTAMIAGKRVMITGAGGSIGSELCRQVATLGPEKIVLLDACEYNLYSIDQELAASFPTLDRIPALADVRDRTIVERWMKMIRPEIVLHAAALKHVPLLESHAIEAIKTNVLGTVNVAELCLENEVTAMVTISTDKAVNPYNIMGATKRLAEAFCQGLDQAATTKGETRFVTVRFGNVLGSAGSVVPLFQRQIETGGPVTVTDPNITRYFMTIPEAVTLVLQAGAQSISLEDERGSIYVLDMGQPVKILDLAKQMIRLAGRRLDTDIKIEIIGLRPGEKLYEEVLHREESVSATANKSVFRATPRVTDIHILRSQVQELRSACANQDEERAVRILKLSVPEFAEILDRRNLIQVK